MAVSGKEKQGARGAAVFLEIANPGAVFLCALFPALYGLILVAEKALSMSLYLSLVLVLVPCLLNVSINFFNDYYDYIKGNDQADTVADISEAPILKYGLTDVRPVLWAGWGCLLATAVLGLTVIRVCQPIAIVIWAIGALTVLAYSGKGVSLSHLPVGELVAGAVLGLLIPLGVYSAFTGRVSWVEVYRCLPFFFNVAHIMLLNNTCDIEKDRAAGRKTLPILLGRERAKGLYRVMLVLWLLVTLHIALVWHTWGTPLYLLALLLLRKPVAASLKLERVQSSKTADMGSVALIGLAIGALMPVMGLIQLIFA